MLVLALDTATAWVAAALCHVAAPAEPPQVLARFGAAEPQRHGELASVALRTVVQQGGATVADVGAVVVGLGPGPFTGLRVGVATAAAFAEARGIPALGACTLDALAEPGAVVVTDARRREVYWAAFDAAGRRVAGPDVARPADLADQLRRGDVVAGPPPGRVMLGPGALQHRDAFDVPGVTVLDGPGAVPVERLVALRAPTLLPAAGFSAVGEALRPLYLRRPDAVPPAGRARPAVPA